MSDNPDNSEPCKQTSNTDSTPAAPSGMREVRGPVHRCLQLYFVILYLLTQLVLLYYFYSFLANISSPPVNGTSAPPRITTTGAPATTTTAAPTQEPKIKLGFKLRESFKPELANKSSPAFKDLENKVTTQVSLYIFSSFFHLSISQMKHRKFR